MAGLSRRAFVGAGAAGVAGGWLAGCGQSTPLPDDSAPAVRPDDVPLARPDGVDDPAWAHVRAAFDLEAGTAYMNNAGLGMPPGSVARAVAEGYQAVSRQPRRATGELRELVAGRVRPGLAAFLGADEHELSLTRNATEALHLSAAGFDLRPGDEVVFTTQEHPAGRRPWQLRAARDGIVTREVFVPSPLLRADDVIEAFEAALTPRTRVVAFCHVTRGGHLYPVRRLAALARERDILTHVDGAQAVGMFPIDLHDLGCDTYSASLHKWFLGPMGTGFLYVRASARERIRSAFAYDATPDNPALEPPGTRCISRLHGFRGVPQCGLVPMPPKANSTVWVLPTMQPMPFRIAWTTGPSRSQAAGSGRGVPAWVRVPTSPYRSFTDTGRPWRGPKSRPSANAASASSAAAVARSGIQSL